MKKIAIGIFWVAVLLSGVWLLVYGLEHNTDLANRAAEVASGFLLLWGSIVGFGEHFFRDFL